jgi:RNA polymerase sigma factor (sigma-70 family)
MTEPLSFGRCLEIAETPYQRRHMEAVFGPRETTGTSRSVNPRRPTTLGALTPSNTGDVGQRGADSAIGVRRAAQRRPRYAVWERRSKRWRRLMIAAQGGESHAYERLLRELDTWLRRYYARRLPGPAAEDARQNALLAIHTARHTYEPSRPFGPWVAMIARYKWIDSLRDASRSKALSLDDEIPMQDHGEAVISAKAMNDLLNRLKPAQATVIRLVKLDGVSIEEASNATGQSAALVKINIHRGLKKLMAWASCDVASPR